MMPVCVWTMIQHVISISTWFIFFVYIEHLGERALAISNICRSVSGLLWVVLQSFAGTCSTLVSNIIGEGHQDKVLSLVKRVLKLSLGTVCAMVILFCIFPEAVARIYTDNKKVRIVLFIMLCTVYILTEFIKHIIIFDIVLILISICLFTFSIFYILKRYKAY